MILTMARSKPLLTLSQMAYDLARPLIFRSSAQSAHHRVLAGLRWLDGQSWAIALLRSWHHQTFTPEPVTVGGVDLPYPLMLAAGFVKGDGFADEDAALDAVHQGHNIIPGWRSMPALVGPVEFGSFTRWPRLGNSGTVMWRDAPTQSTQNRVGLRNPGARAAAAFLNQQQAHLPKCYGINLAVSPGVADLQQEQAEIVQALGFFLDAGIRPNWFTLNLSCPNTEDDPGGQQTASKTLTLCRAFRDRCPDIPLWVKVSPELSDAQYAQILAALAEAGAQAIIATNTLAHPTPDNPEITAGVGGGRLHKSALAATIRLRDITRHKHYPVDIIGCGGVLDGAHYQAFRQAGAHAVQYWSALVYRGPLAAALIINEGGYAE
jgi:dihydroorotate dehydrogenase